MLFGSGKPVVGKASAIIHKPIGEVFQFIGEDFLTNYPRWSPEVVDLKRVTEGPVQVGCLMKQVRIDHGHKSESTFRVTDFEVNRRLAFTGVSNSYRCIYDLGQPTGAPDVTRVEFTFEFPVLEGFLRPFEKLVRIAVQEGADRTVRNLKGLIEREARTA
jgi:hypothetical protein